MSARFYVNLPLAPGPFTLDGPEARHLSAVCRFRPGDVVCLFNGDGCEYPARIVAVGRREVELEIERVESPPRELGFALEVAAPLPKGDRSQFLIEKLTELGATTFVPLLSKRSIIHPREGKREKMERFIIEASKQCGRNVLMQIAEPIDWESYASQVRPGELRIVAHPGDSGAWERSAWQGNWRIGVGPEGGFTDEEIAHAKHHRWHPVSLGPRILRIETAAIALAARASFAPSFTSGSGDDLRAGIASGEPKT